MNKHTVDIVTVGERGQVVIPAAIREQTGVKAGDKLMVFTKHGDVICLVSTSSMRQLVETLNEHLSEVDEDQEKKEGK